MRMYLFAGLAVLAWLAAPASLPAQGAESGWQLDGLRTGFCIELLLDPSQAPLQDLPPGYRPRPASETEHLHVSLRGVIAGQPEFASWSPSRLCFVAVDTIRSSDFSVRDKSGRHPQLFGLWTVTATDGAGREREVALDLFGSSGRLVRAAQLAGQPMREVRVDMGKVPEVNDDGVPSTDDRFQVKVGKTLVTWDGPPANDSTPWHDAVSTEWVGRGVKGGVHGGGVRLAPRFSRPMSGALKVEGKDAFAKALRSSPTRFAGPAYRGGEGTVEFAQ